MSTLQHVMFQWELGLSMFSFLGYFYFLIHVNNPMDLHDSMFVVLIGSLCEIISV